MISTNASGSSPTSDTRSMTQRLQTITARVEEMNEGKKTSAYSDTVKNYLEGDKKLDANGDGRVDVAEFNKSDLFKNLGKNELALLFANPTDENGSEDLNVDQVHLEAVFERADDNKDGDLTAEEIQDLVKNLKAEHRQDGKLDKAAVYASLHGGDSVKSSKDAETSDDAEESKPSDQEESGIQWGSVLDSVAPAGINLVASLMNRGNDKEEPVALPTPSLISSSLIPPGALSPGETLPRTPGVLSQASPSSPFVPPSSSPYDMTQFGQVPPAPVASAFSVPAAPVAPSTPSNAWSPSPTSTTSSSVAGSHGFNVMAYTPSSGNGQSVFANVQLGATTPQTTGHF